MQAVTLDWQLQPRKDIWTFADSKLVDLATMGGCEGRRYQQGQKGLDIEGPTGHCSVLLL